jgi:hypothetical protein
MTDKIEEEVMAAYSDCNQESYKYGSGERNLHFRASEQVSVDEAKRIMKKAIPRGYNAFRADLLDHLPPECKVEIAREYSVCIYVEYSEDNISWEDEPRALFDAGARLGTTMNADEVNYVPHDDHIFVVRIWWD